MTLKLCRNSVDSSVSKTDVLVGRAVVVSSSNGGGNSRALSLGFPGYGGYYRIFVYQSGSMMPVSPNKADARNPAIAPRFHNGHQWRTVAGRNRWRRFAIATGLAREGARVIVNGRSEKAVVEAKEQIEQTVPDARIESFAGDLSSAAATQTLLQRFPLVDILVNNLGIFEPKPFEDIPDEDWRRFFEVNVLSGVRLSRAYLPGMKQRNWGRIVFISSESAINTPAEMIHYGMTKTAQLAVSRGLAQLCAGTAYVCSPLSAATNGAALRVDGGVVQACF